MSLTVTRSNGTSDIVFSLQQNKDQQRVFINPASTVAEPETITLQAFLKPVNAKGSDRYLFKAQKTFQEDTTGNTIHAVARLEIVIPRSTESGLMTAVADQVAFLKSMMTAANIAALAAGVMPPEGDYHVDTFNPA